MSKPYPYAARSGLLLIFFVFFSVHAALYWFDLGDPSAFLRGDRAAERLERISEFISAQSHYWTLFSAPFPGDFALSAVLYRLGGQYLVIGVQIAIQFAIVVGVYICLARVSGRKIALAASLLLVAMPGTLMNTHMLVTETWVGAFISAGILSLSLSMNEQRELRSAAFLLLGFAALTLAMSIRPQGLLLPLAMALVLLAIMKGGRTFILIGAVASYLVFPLSLMLFHLWSGGQFSLGESSADLGTNLLLRANRILYNSYFEVGQKLTISEFVSIAASHPIATLNTYYADAVNLLLNPGSNHVFGFYLRLYNPEDFRFWVGLLDRAGASGVAGQLIREGTPFLVTFLVWMIIHLIILFGTGAAVVQAFRERKATPAWVWLTLVAAGVYLATAFTSGQLRWSHRSGVEALLVVLAAWGLTSIQQLKGAKSCDPS